MCILRASGTEFDVDAFAAVSTWRDISIQRRGEAKLPRSQPNGLVRTESRLSLKVSRASWDDLPAQIADAEAFLIANRDEIERLRSTRGVADLVLDFPIHSRIRAGSVLGQFDRFPATLVKLAGDLGLAIELSSYLSDEP